MSPYRLNSSHIRSSESSVEPISNCSRASGGLCCAASVALMQATKNLAILYYSAHRGHPLATAADTIWRRIPRAIGLQAPSSWPGTDSLASRMGRRRLATTSPGLDCPGPAYVPAGRQAAHLPSDGVPTLRIPGADLDALMVCTVAPRRTACRLQPTTAAPRRSCLIGADHGNCASCAGSGLRSNPSPRGRKA
jgi:hypothetical protein